MAGLIETYVYVGIKGHVVALDSATGTERWRSKLKGGDFVNVVTDGTRIFAATQGEIFCLDGATGTPLWHNQLKGLGLGLASILPGSAPSAGPGSALAEQHRRARAGAAAAG
ncbi:MAG TPA: PQQ-binding-like beta-propeller repeat protein [Gemmatimonadales bacterium]